MGHAREGSSGSAGAGGGGGGPVAVGSRAETRKLWVVLGKKGRGFRPKQQTSTRVEHEEDEQEEEDDWVTVGLERNVSAR